MIIEFVGIPGSGKTTLAKSLAAEKGYQYIETIFWYEKFIYLASFKLRFPIRYLRLIGITFIQGIRAKSLKLFFHKFKVLFSSVIATAKALSLSKKQTVILDQGLAQYGLGLFEGYVSRQQAEQYVRRFVLSDDITFVQTGPNVAKERLQKRGNIPRQNLLSSEKWEQWYDVVVCNSEIFKTVYETTHPHPNGK